MRIERVFTTAGGSPYDGIGFRTATSEIRNPDGSVVFRRDKIEVPSAWSQVAVDVLAQKYFRKAGVPRALAGADEPGVPEWLQRRRVDQPALEALPGAERYDGETSAKQVFDRLAGTWTYWGWKGGDFDSEADAKAFFDELRCMLACQQAAPNSPQWFNTGLNWAYGIDGPAQGHYFADDQTGEVGARPPPTSGRSRTPASSRASRTTWSTRAASWTSGCARRACSNTARAPAPIFPACAAMRSRSPAAASRRA